ncbi:MAG: multidrug efflux transporter EmrAB transcriptional repressor EmrR [Candidatus Kapaibacteriales bacterium]
MDIKGKYNLETSIGYSTQLLTQHLAERLIRKLLKRGIEMNIDEWIALVHIHDFEKQNQNQLVKATNRNKTAVTRLVNDLEKKGWVERLEDDNDRRNNHIILTEEGKSIFKTAISYAEDTVSDTTKDISDQDYNTWKTVTEKMIYNAKSYDPDGKY